MSLVEYNIGAAIDMELVAWQHVIEKLRSRNGESFNSWLKPLCFEAMDAGIVTMSVPTKFICNWVDSRYKNEIYELWRVECPDIKGVQIIVKAPKIDVSQVSCGASSSSESSGENLGDKNTANIVSTLPSLHNNRLSGKFSEFESKINSKFTFDNFIIGESNQLAFAAAKNIAEATSLTSDDNPLFLYGGVGLGKTHLMQAIVNHVREYNPKRKAAYISAEKFMYQFIRCLQNKNIGSFKEYFRSVDILMVDDLQFICGKNSTQEEFFHTFNALVDDKKQLILSCDRSPSELENIDERLKSRLGGGLVADINNADYQLRLGILRSKVTSLVNVDVPDSVVELLAQKISSNTRELEGGLNKIIAHARLTKIDITIEGTQKILKDLLRTNCKTITIEDIKQTVADHFSIKISEMNSSRKTRNIARPRQIAMHLSKQLTQNSLPEIGKNFGGKDHSTVVYAVKKIASLSANDQKISSDIQEITHKLQG